MYQQEDLTETPDNRAYRTAECDTPHHDGSFCLPGWDGFVYVCTYKLDKEIAERPNPLGVLL